MKLAAMPLVAAVIAVSSTFPTGDTASIALENSGLLQDAVAEGEPWVPPGLSLHPPPPRFTRHQQPTDCGWHPPPPRHHQPTGAGGG